MSTGSADGTVVACVDFGSTFTKAALVEVPTGRLVATATHRTTIDTDVIDGWDACRAALAEADPRAESAEVLACSSAGGGLRIAVVGNEELVTAEAGRRVALSSGGRVVHMVAGGLPWAGLAELRSAKPDVLLLVGGTDGGNAEVLLSCATTLAEARWRGPVVVAGNTAAQDEVHALLDDAGTPHVVADNVLPRIGVLAPDSARAAIREMFLRHVIGGKHLSSRADFTEMVRGATPDVVLTAVELLGRGLGEDRPGAGDVVVVDIGGATTDVHSVVEVDPEEAGLSRQVVATVPVSRTVEGDLGMRWSAVATVEEGIAAGLVDPGLREAAAVRQADPAYLPPAGPEGAGVVPTTGPSRPPRRQWRCAGTPAALRSCSARTVGSSSAVARTCARSVCWSGRAECCGTAATTPTRCCCGTSALTGAGSSRNTRARWSTGTTCWRRSACSLPNTPTRRTGWPARCSDPAPSAQRPRSRCARRPRMWSRALA